MALSAAERQRLYRQRKKARETAGHDNSQRSPQQRVARRDDWHGLDDLEAFLKALPRVVVGPQTGYTETDRARDFIAVFGTESGQRVLTQISQICDRPVSENDAGDHGRLAYRAGMRRVFSEVMRCFVIREEVTIETRGPTEV